MIKGIPERFRRSGRACLQHDVGTSSREDREWAAPERPREARPGVPPPGAACSDLSPEAHGARTCCGEHMSDPSLRALTANSLRIALCIRYNLALFSLTDLHVCESPRQRTMQAAIGPQTQHSELVPEPMGESRPRTAQLAPSLAAVTAQASLNTRSPRDRTCRWPWPEARMPCLSSTADNYFRWEFRLGATGVADMTELAARSSSSPRVRGTELAHVWHWCA